MRVANYVDDTTPYIYGENIEPAIKALEQLVNLLFKEVRYNCRAHRSAHLFILAIRSYSHIKRKQPQKTFLQYSCSVTMIHIVKKYL